MTFIKKYQFEIVGILLLVILYFVLRLSNLTLQPIFADEAIYIRWAQVMRAEPTLRFLPLSDGKTPMFMWLTIPLFKIFDDPLYAGRFLSVLSGFATLVGVFLLSLRLFNLRTAFWAALFYVVTPYTFFFDRMALVDSMLAASLIWSMYTVSWLLKYQRLDLAMILGYFLGGALLVKTPAMLFILSLPISVLAFDFKNSKKYAFAKLLGCFVISLIIALGIYNILRLGPGFTQLSVRNADYVFSLTELSGRPWDPFLPHFWDIVDWFPKLLTIGILGSIFVGMYFLIIRRNLAGIAILLWALAPLLIEMAFLKTFTARYLLFSIPPMLVIAGFGINSLLELLKTPKVINIILALALFLPQSLYFDYLLLTDPQAAPLPRAERRGYLEDWTAGYGFPEIAKFLIEKKKTKPVVVGTEGYFGTLPDGLKIYLGKSDIPVIGSSASISAQLRDSARQNQTFFVANKNRLYEGGLKNVKLIQEYPKAVPHNNLKQDAIVVYQVFPE